MPYSSNPVYVSPGDNVQVRYPTPDTWNTTVTVNLRIGTGQDPNGITFGTKIPDATPDNFSFNDQNRYNAYDGNSNNTLTGGTSTIERNTQYHSSLIIMSGFEVPIDGAIAAVANGPDDTNTSISAQFRIFRDGSFVTNWVTSISGDLNDGTGGIQPGDKIQLRVTTPDWYTTWTRVTFSVNETTVGGGLGSEYVTAGVTNSAIKSGTWDITTRAQDQTVPSNELNFTDYVDTPPTSAGGQNYYYKKVDISDIDADTVLRCSRTGGARILKVEGGGGNTAPTNGYTSNTITGIVLGDDVWVRMPNGTNYTEKETGSINLFAQGGDTYTRGGTSYRNNNTGSYGSGDYQVTQNLGSVSDDWQIWTEVDRYPDAIAATPVFTYGIKTAIHVVGGVSQTGSGFNTTDVFDTTGGSGSGMKVQLLPGGVSNSSFSTLENGDTTAFIVDAGYGYAANDIVTIVSTGGSNAQIRILEYEKVTVSQTTEALCEPGFMYYADMPVSGLGTEYASNSYNDLENPISGLVNTDIGDVQSTNNDLNGQTVKIAAIIDGTGGQIRKNNTGAWSSTQVIVENGDTINVKRNSNTSFGGTTTTKVRLKGPPSGNPTIGNPTQGPSSPSYPDKETTLTLTTRSRRVIPYPFHADPVFLSNPNQEHIAEVNIEGLDDFTNASITSGSGDLSVNETAWNSTITIQPTDTTLYIKTNASTQSGGLQQLTYKIYRDGQEVTDTFRIYTRIFDNTGNYPSLEADASGGGTDPQVLELPYFATEDFYVSLVGAGGGRGGNDAPNSQGAGGGSGNFLRMRVRRSDFPDQVGFPGVKDGRILAYAPTAGQDGSNYVSNAGGGAGGWGYATGGNGGNAGSGDNSGGGGGGGGAAAITMYDGTLIALVGGGGGGAGAGNDTSVPAANAFGNHGDDHGLLNTTTSGIIVGGDDAPNATGQGAGPGGGGGGYNGSAGILLTQKTDEDGNVIQTTDLDATGGTGGGAYYDPSNTTILNGSTLSGRGAGPGGWGRVIIEYAPQDTTPLDFDFTQLDGIAVNTEVISNRALIEDITGQVPIQISSPGWQVTARVCSSDSDASCGDWGATAIGNNQYIQLKGITGVVFNSPYEAQVEVGDTASTWIVNTGPPPDTTVNFYNFTDVDPAALDVLVSSELVTISGINVPVSVFATDGAEAKIYDSDNNVITDWTVANSGNALTIENNQKIQFRVTSANDYEQTVEVTITIGTGSSAETTWSVKTQAEVDTRPDSFSFLDVSNANINTTYTSNSNQIEGLGGPTYFQVDYGDSDQSNAPNPELALILIDGVVQYDIDGVTPLTVVQIENLDQISLRYTTTATLGEPRQFITRSGGIYNATTQEVEGTDDYPLFETDWRVTTAGSFVANPDPFTFSTVLATGPSVLTQSAETALIGGLGQVTPFITTNGLEVSVDGGPYNPSSGEYSVTNGNVIQVQLESSPIPGLTRTGQIQIGNYTTSFTVQTPAPIQDPINSQWYSSIQPCKYILAGPDAGSQIRFDTKFDGLPVGSIMPVFQDGTQDDNWGDLDGEITSRFPGFLYCDGGYVDPEKYPMLYAVIADRYGAELVVGETFTTTLYDISGNILKEEGDPKILMRLPDYRNRYIKGTGVIDGTQLSSPSLAPTYGPDKLPASPGSLSPGAFGGMWYVDTIGDPGVGELEQVETPAEGLPATESDFFGIANVVTTGYSDVQGSVEFITSGKCATVTGLKKQKIYDVPLHFHELITGQADPGNFKGRVNWGSDGGFRSPAESSAETPFGKVSTNTGEYEKDYSINQWGYFINDGFGVPNAYLPKSAYCPSDDAIWWDGTKEDWSDPSGYIGWESIGGSNQIPLESDQMLPGSTAWDEINSYIDAANSPWPGTGSSNYLGVNGARKQFTSVDIPSKQANVKGYSPPSKLFHNHYVSLSAMIEDETDQDDPQYLYSHGNFDTFGNSSDYLNENSGTYENDKVTLEFDAIADLGVQVLPGTFTLSQTKQLVPTPALSPQDEVALMSPYTWTKWLIKAY